ncbi:MAG: response regulator transcription factor [Prosthecobacter sp.]
MSFKSSSPIRVILVDDHPFLRQGVALSLKGTGDIEVCGEAPDCATAVRVADEIRPDVVVTDLTLPDKSGLELIRILREQNPAMNILVLSMHDEDSYAERCLRAGAKGYVMKSRGPDQLAFAIREVAAGRIYVSPDLAQRLLTSLTYAPVSQTAERLGELQDLSDREFEVFELLGRGKTSKEIGSMLGISSKTVDVHRMNIRQKLHVKTNPDLIHQAVRWVQSNETNSGM